MEYTLAGPTFILSLFLDRLGVTNKEKCDLSVVCSRLLFLSPFLFLGFARWYSVCSGPFFPKYICFVYVVFF